jgi:hypothetical protein
MSLFRGGDWVALRQSYRLNRLDGAIRTVRRGITPIRFNDWANGVE